MSRPAFTLKAFSVYLLLLGPGLILAPGFFLSLFGMPVPADVWVRVVGVTVFNIGVYYWHAAKSEAVPFFWASVYARTFVFVSFTTFVLFGLANPVLILFGAADLGGALWTLSAMRSSRKMAGVQS